MVIITYSWFIFSISSHVCVLLVVRFLLTSIGISIFLLFLLTFLLKFIACVPFIPEGVNIIVNLYVRQPSVFYYLFSMLSYTNSTHNSSHPAFRLVERSHCSSFTHVLCAGDTRLVSACRFSG